jgi:hypothetical protein
MAADDTLAQVTSRYEQQLLDEELNSLPAKYREPLVLRYLLGKSNKQVADELALSDETSSSNAGKAQKKPRLATIEALPGCLVINQSQHAHEEITDLLMQLDRYDTSMKMLRRPSNE